MFISQSITCKIKWELTVAGLEKFEKLCLDDLETLFISHAPRFWDWGFVQPLMKAENS